MIIAPSKAPAAATFWRDGAFPHIEARCVRDGRNVSYASHSHDTFSIGAVNGGTSVYANRTRTHTVGAGTVVIMNPQDVHACNPHGAQPWSYRMLYVDVRWLTGLQHDLGWSRNGDFRGFSTISTLLLHRGMNRFFNILIDHNASLLQKHSAAVEFFSDVQQTLDPAPQRRAERCIKLLRAAEFISDNCTRSLSLDEICATAHLSPAYLIRAFKSAFGMTPHAYLINRRIQLGRSQLRKGLPIADVAIDLGFADQAHFQRAFKQYVAVTPGRYRA